MNKILSKRLEMDYKEIICFGMLGLEREPRSEISRDCAGNYGPNGSE